MKKTNKYISIIALFTIAILACDKIEEPILESSPTIPDPDTPTTEAVQRILIQDYTGHRCVNCPKAHRKLEELQEKYGDLIVPMAIHYDYFAQTNNEFTIDFTTAVGDVLGDYYDVISPPTGTINQTEYNGEALVAWQNWEAAYDLLVNETPKIAIKASNDFNEGNQTISSTIEIELTESLEGDYSVASYIIEDNIVAPQLDNEATPNLIEDYEHMHVLRGALNDAAWGESLITTSAEAGSTFNADLTLSWNSEWNANNCHTITVLINDDTKEIVNVIMTPVKE